MDKFTRLKVSKDVQDMNSKWKNEATPAWEGHGNWCLKTLRHKIWFIRWNKSQEGKGDWEWVAEDEDDDCLAVVLILSSEAKAYSYSFNLHFLSISARKVHWKTFKVYLQIATLENFARPTLLILPMAASHVGWSTWPHSSSNLGNSEGTIIPHSTQDSFFVVIVTHLLPLPSFYFPPFHGCQSHKNSGINVLQANLCLRICFLAPGNPTFQSGEELFFFSHFLFFFLILFYF